MSICIRYFVLVIFLLFLILNTIEAVFTKPQKVLYIMKVKSMGIIPFTHLDYSSQYNLERTDADDDSIYKDLYKRSKLARVFVGNANRNFFVVDDLRIINAVSVPCNAGTPYSFISIAGPVATQCLYGVREVGIGKVSPPWYLPSPTCTYPSFLKQVGNYTFFYSDYTVPSFSRRWMVSVRNSLGSLYACNTINNAVIEVHPDFLQLLGKDYLSEYLSISLAKGNTLGTVSLTTDRLQHYFLKYQVSGMVTVPTPFRYVCGDYLGYQVYYAVNLFPNTICSKYVGFNSTHDICFDMYIGGIVCPDYWFRPTIFVGSGVKNTYNVLIKPTDVTASAVLSLYSALSDKLESLAVRTDVTSHTLATYILNGIGNITRVISSNLTMNDSMSHLNFDDLEPILNRTNHDNFLDYNSTYYSLVDYLLSGMGKNDDLVEGLFGNWISNIFKALIDPFVKAWLSAVASIWTEIGKILVTVFTDLINVFVEIVGVLVNVITNIIEALLPVLNKLAIGLVGVVTTLVKTLFLVFTKIEESYWLVEFIVLFVLLNVYLVNSIYVNLIISFLIACITGISRPPNSYSWFLRLVHPELQEFYNSTMSGSLY